VIIKHYVELFRLCARWIYILVASATLLTLGISLIRLRTSPVYTATASVALLPTAAEFEFGRETGAGPRGTTQGLTATYMEYLKSRPVVESAYDRIAQSSSAQAEERVGGIAGFARRLAFNLRMLYRTLDSGEYVIRGERESEIEKFSSAIRVESVPNSFIIRVSVGLEDPEAAAAAVNALAEASVQRVSEQFARSAGEIGGVLREQIELRESQMKALVAREEELRRGFSTSSLETERLRLFDNRERERRELLDAQAALEAARAEIAVLSRQNVVQSGRSVADLSTARGLAEAKRQAAQGNVDLRQKTIADIDATIAALQSKEEPLQTVQRQLEEVKIELAALHSRELTTNLAGSSAMATVRIIDPAVTPVYPSSPRVLRDTGAAFLAGLLTSLLLLVLADTLSSTVKTTSDLERLAQSRNLGEIPGRRVVSKGWFRKVRRKLARFAADLERDLTLLGVFEHSAVLVTGFTDRRQIGLAAATMGAALASRGLAVRCDLGPGKRPPDSLEAFAAHGVSFDSKKEGSTRRGKLLLECLSPVSAQLKLSELGERPRLVICVVPMGEVAERDVLDFQAQAVRAGVPVAFALVPPQKLHIAIRVRGRLPYPL